MVVAPTVAWRAPLDNTLGPELGSGLALERDSEVDCSGPVTYPFQCILMPDRDMMQKSLETRR